MNKRGYFYYSAVEWGSIKGDKDVSVHVATVFIEFHLLASLWHCSCESFSYLVVATSAFSFHVSAVL